MKSEFKLNQKAELLVLSAWINPCYGINLILIASLTIFKTMCRRNIHIIEQSELSKGQRSMVIAFGYCLQKSESGGQTVWKIIGLILCLFMYMSYMYIFTYPIGLILYIYLIFFVYLLRFLLALNFIFSKIKMFKLMFILFVIKQLLGNLTPDNDTYSAKLSIIRLGKAKWWQL